MKERSFWLFVGAVITIAAIVLGVLLAGAL